MLCNLYYNDGTVNAKELEFSITKSGNVTKYVLTQQLNFEELKKMDIPLNTDEILVGDEGFYTVVEAQGKVGDCGIGYFREREDQVYLCGNTPMHILGYKHKQECYLFIAVGMAENIYQKVQVDKGKYSLYFQVVFNDGNFLGEIPYEPISFERHRLTGKDMSYSGMAREYRNYQLNNGFVAIKDRLDKYIKYTAESMLVRVRMGWKPVPCTVFEQTPETEPPMHVACTFADVGRLMDAYKDAGIKKVEFSLVGWNIKGHDGRWPQILPVEESLGGEKELRKLVEKAREYGYCLTCHTNSTDAYSVAENFDMDDIIVLRDGNINLHCKHWAGGSTYNICPERALKLAKETLPAVRELGFEGCHYIDVITAVKARACHNKNHPLNKKQGAEYWNQIMLYAKQLFGGIASECGFDHSLKHCDYVLYVSFNKNYMKPNSTSVIDEYVPFWQLVYHGIVTSNPYSKTVNAAIASSKSALLKSVEYGARPTLYVYSQFVTDGTNWISDKDLTLDDDEALKTCVECAVKEAEVFDELAYLQYEFMEEHTKIADGVYSVTYSDGSVVTVDYNNETYELKRG